MPNIARNHAITYTYTYYYYYYYYYYYCYYYCYFILLLFFFFFSFPIQAFVVRRFKLIKNIVEAKNSHFQVKAVHFPK